jgi:hypothetical protein|tara:strand:- start:7006 stop:7278 length:273 start_codon:yes stop_codon:yes gene_type:complete
VTSLSRKLKRQKEKEAKNELTKKVGLFGKLEDECLVCQEPFDKKDKDMVMSWSVVVKNDDVRLYCPTCWGTAKQLVEEMRDGYTNTKTDV